MEAEGSLPCSQEPPPRPGLSHVNPFKTHAVPLVSSVM
jgi:hypothetical protein